MPKLRWSKFFWSDWRSDPGIRAVSLEARGFWMELLCLMSESPVYGVLACENESAYENVICAKPDSCPVDVPPLSRQCPASVRALTNEELGAILAMPVSDIDRLLSVLVKARICSVNGGFIVCRRMVREEQERTKERARKMRWRSTKKTDTAKCPAVVPSMSRSSPGQRLEARGQRLEAKTKNQIHSGDACASPAPIENDRRVVTGSAPPPITFDFDKAAFAGITATDRKAWADAYPAVDVDRELAKAAAWQVANPEKRKRNYRRFLVNWLARSQDNGGSRGNPNNAPNRIRSTKSDTGYDRTLGMGWGQETHQTGGNAILDDLQREMDAGNGGNDAN